MNGKRAKWLNKLIVFRNPVLLTLIRNHYGELTAKMSPKQVYRAAKKLWKKGEIQKVKGWPTHRSLMNMQKSSSKTEK